MMKNVVLFSVLFGMLPCTMMAQDDLYFKPKKQSKVESTVEDLQKEEPASHSGSDRDVDEYNRRGKLSSYYQKIGEDSLGNDIIVFHAGDGTYDVSKADTVYRGSGTFYDDSDDYAYSRRMSRFDGWYDPWLFGHSYYPWYDAWYDPWYYGYGYGWRWHYGWYDPWFYGYYGYYGWGYPYYRYGYYGWGYPRSYAFGGRSGTRNHRFPRYGGQEGGRHTYGRSQTSRTYGTRNRSYGNNTNRGWNNNNTWNNAPARSSGSFGSFGGGSFGGSRGGGFGGGSRSGGGGGGHFGGRR